MPQNQKTYKLSEVTTKIGSGSTPRGGKGAYKEDGISLIRSQNILDFAFSENGLAFIDDAQASKLNNVIVEEDDVLLNITGDSVARVCKVPKSYLPARVNQHVAIIRADNQNLDSDFLKYALLEFSNKNKLLNLSSAGATRKAITKSMIEDFELNLPPLPEQTAIASILSTIDAKIENNLAINKTLEEMAMALYKEWFVDFGPFQDGKFVDSELGMIPEGWEVKRLDEIALVKGGKRLPKGNQLQKEPNIHPYIRVKDFDKAFVLESNLEYVPDDIFNSISRYIVNTDDVILSIVGTVGSVALIGANLDNASLTENCAKISLIDNNISSEVLYMYLTSIEGQDDIKNKTVGSTQPKLPIYNIKNIQFAFPNIKNRVKVPVIQIEHNMKTIYSNLIQNQSLTTLRDTLLPKLTSGEVRLNEFANT